MGGEPQIAGAGQQRSAVQVAAGIASRQFGAVSRRQLLARGVSEGQIRHWLATGRLHLRSPGVYAWGRADLPEAGELAAGLLAAGHGSALTGITALWWLELLHRRPSLIHVASPARRRSPPGIVVCEMRGLERRAHRGLPVVPLPFAILPATRDLTHDSLRLVIARAEYGRLLDRRELERALRSGRRGTRALRAAVDAHLPQLARCANGLERDFVLLCERRRIPLPEPNPRIRRYRPDMLWREARLIVELDGRGAHSTPAQLAADARRQAALEAMGFTVIRFGWRDVEVDEARVVAEVRRWLRR
jgi:hypothetical protein